MIGWLARLVITLVDSIWTGLTKRRLAVNRVGVEFVFGGFFFLLPLLTAVGDDIHRNWGAQECTVAWNPRLVWKTFLYLGALFFFVAALLAYHQAICLTASFISFSI